ncbi:Rne/Rng family ribonuclease [Leucobacter ruminantium]|uniref:Ribonuclease E n=1 Tax=Leucobacter ruminantium TaxID=1289170 RepID=A0A939RYS6_9MICO|nr:Rne/Rng family ribonuclease [Leucobacter ruminantium]MBO1805176.1 Rne/Rng family ribonuclease [Leucobacter ruminantium]
MVNDTQSEAAEAGETGPVEPGAAPESRADAAEGPAQPEAAEASENTEQSESTEPSEAAEPSEGTEQSENTVQPENTEQQHAPGSALVPQPVQELTPEERFRATTKLIFIAPDVPPIPPRPRRSELGRLDDILDRRFGRDEEPDEREEREQTGGSRRRRQRGADTASDDEAPRRRERQVPVVTEPQKVKGSTRLEAKKQRRRDGRDAGRRRMVITESEFLARREAVDREMIVRTTADRVQIGVLEDKVLVEHYVARSSENSLIGNVYLGRVQNVLPSMEAAFVDIGRGRNAVLYSGEVDWSEFEGSNSARKIENALKPGDQVLVQVTKDPVGHKGARLTSQISLPGRFLVYVPGGAMNGISRKLPDTERARLKKILKAVLPDGAGVIVRTAAEGASEEQLTTDVQRLARQWESIRARAEKGGGPLLLHSEPDMLIKIIRDVFNEDFHKLVISGADTYRVIEEYLTQVAPDLMQRVERYEGERDVFGEYRVQEQIAKALDRKVWLPSGGSLVIDRTEAMTVVDVNTGKFVGSGGNLEETVTKNNLEAAEEIVRQLRLRDIGGIIVVDFIDMVLESNRDLVLRRLVECLSRDRTKHQVAEVTSLGLVQMTRKKLGLGLLESFSDPCEVCAGRGIIVHHEPVTKHRSEGSGRGSRRGKGSQPPQAQQHAQEHKAQTHAITDGAKNMLAQVAASTIPVAKNDGASDRPSAAGRGEQRAGEASRADDAPRDRGEGRAPDDLLNSLLDALPEAPAAGTGRARGRRAASLRASSSDRGATRDSEAAREAQAALAQALEETSKRAADAGE